MNLQNTSRMKTRMLNGQILILLIMSLISSSKTSENLECFTDGINLITCVWNTSLVEDITPTTHCFLRCKFYDYTKNQIIECPLVPQQQPQLREGTLKFLDNTLIYGPPFLPLDVWCEPKREVVDQMNFDPLSYVKMYPPKKPLVTGSNITWQCSSLKSELVNDVVYEVQWGLLENNWEKSLVASTKLEQCELPEEKLILGREYMVRVRSASEDEEQIWSEWSPVTKWKSTVGVAPEDPIIPGGFHTLTSLGVIIPVAVFILVFFWLQRNMTIIKCQYVPTPEKYFGELFSEHRGEFKSWLGPTVNQMYVQNDSESISPVTVFKVCNTDVLSKPKEKDVNIKDGSSSSFSNSIYFLSQSSKSRTADQLEPCSADSPYGPAGGGSVQEKILPAVHDNGSDTELNEVPMGTPLEMSSSNKQLQKLRLDIQSPDSGFAGSSGEQESQEESGSEGLPSPPVVDNTLPIHCNLPCPVPQMTKFPQLGFPPGPVLSPWNNQPFQNLPLEITKNALLGNSSTLDCSGILEPSSDDYMPVKNV